MKSTDDMKHKQRFEEAKRLASRIMHKHYCEHDIEEVTALFSPQFSWIGAGEEEFLTGRKACVDQFQNYKDAIPKCNIWDEEYDVINPSEGLYVVTGRMWIATDASSEMYLKVHQRVTFVLQDAEGGMKCAHIHCSNPYQEMMEGEYFPDKIGRQSYDYIQERLHLLEEETKQQNRQMEVVMSSIAGGLKISRDDDTYSFVFVSKEAAALFGYTVEEFMKATNGSAVGNVYPPDLPKALADCEEAFRDGNLTYSTRYRVRCKDGSLKWIIDSGKKAQDADGNWMVNSLYLDITQHEILQERLDREQVLYRVAMEASSAIMFEYLVDSDTFISYEPQFRKGVIRNELKNYSKILVKQNLVHPDDESVVIDNICNGRTEVFEVRCSTPSGEPGQYFWHRVNSRLITEEGEPSRVVGALHNIHSMKAKLSENSERLHMSQLALQAINDVYVSIFYVQLQQDSYYAVRLPKAAESVDLPRTGNYSTDLCGYILNDVDAADKERVAAICSRTSLMEELARISEHIEVEFRHQQPDLWLRMEAHLIAVTEDKSKTAILAFRNISSEKQRELKYREEEKKAKLALEDAYASVNRANQAKSDFLSRMSHDIRTPMNAILGMTEIAKNNLGDDAKIDDCLSKIMLSGGHLLELINEVLDMSKIESGNVSFHEGVFQLSDLLSEISQMIKPDMDSKKQHYSVNMRSIQHDTVCGDAVRVKQILINLLSNAVKYTGVGGHISIALDEKLSSESGVGCFEIAVEDDGIGMSDEFMDKMFLPFERAEDSRVSQIQGTGLGLAITQNLIHMMDGTIKVESQLNQGTKFVFTIYLKIEQLAMATPVPPMKENLSPRTSFPPETCILLAEDNDLNQEIVKELLSLHGIKTICAVNGMEALNRFSADPPGTYALILMDIQMPVLDGYGAARAIRNLGATGQRPDAAAIPIIALTANAFADDIYRAKQAGMDEHITKPLDMEKLLNILQSYI